MTAILKGLLVATAIALPVVASAQSPVAASAPPVAAPAQLSDVDYCRALVDKYDHYLDIRPRHGRMPQSLEAREAVERCRGGDVAGIPGIEKALQDAKYSLPSRTESVAPTPAKDPNCGAETWSTEKMTYVGVPCP